MANDKVNSLPTLNEKHNKKRNTYLMYEFLSAQLAKHIVDNNKNGVKIVSEILKKYFKSGSILREELNLFDRLFFAVANIKTPELKHEAIGQILGCRWNVNNKLLDSAKSFLIKEVNYKINDEKFYNVNINNYKLYANMQRLFNMIGEKREENATDKIKLLDIILEEINEIKTNKKDENQNGGLNLNTQYTKTVMKFAIDRFDKKYSKILNEQQKKFLSNYIYFNLKNDKESIRKLIDNKKRQITKELNINIILNEVVQKNGMKAKILEVVEKIEKVDSNIINDNDLLVIMSGTELINELKKND